MLRFFENRLVTGRIDEIIALIKEFYQTDSLYSIPTMDKLAVLCFALQININQLDILLSSNPQTVRTI